MNKRIRRFFLIIIALFFLAASPFLWRSAVQRYYQSSIYDVNNVRNEQVAIVYGAAVRNGRLSTVLRDRMDTAIALYETGKVTKLLVSGGVTSTNRNEPNAMMDYAIARGVAAEDIITDDAGDRTYDTCYRARHVFQVDSAILVTQEFHLPRAIFTCNMLGVDAVGVRSDPRRYRAAEFYEVRETFATYRALWDVIRRKPV